MRFFNYVTENEELMIPTREMTEFYEKRTRKHIDGVIVNSFLLGSKRPEIKDKVEDDILRAVKHHLSVNRHHPEHHTNSNDMTVLDLGEMVCDWHSVSLELNGDTMEWAKANIDKWNFNDANKEIIFGFIEDLK